MAHAEQRLRELLDKIAQEHNYYNYDVTITPTSTFGANYTSQLFLATITASGKDDLHLFAKVATISEKIRTQLNANIFGKEIFAYTDISKVFQQLQDKYNVPEEHRLAIPKLYGWDPELFNEILVLENLTAQGYISYDRFKSIDWEYASIAVEELAKLHALSFAYQHEHPKEFAQVMEDYGLEVKIDEQLTAIWTKMAESALEATNEENKERMKKFFEINDGPKFVEYYKPLRSTVFTHGDYRVSNLMHKIQEDGRIHVKVVDYQTYQGSSPVIDLLYFIFTGSDEEFRAKHYSQLIDHYYTQLSEAMRRFGLDPDEIYSREDYDFELKEKLPYSLSIAVFLLPVVTVEAENAPRVDGNMDLTSFNIQKTSDLFAQRLNGIVNDFVKWGVM